MAGFETIVRPVVFPNIRPAPTRSLPPADDPEQGKCEIGGGGGGLIGVSESSSVSGSLHNPKEIQRRVDTARVFQKNDDGTINRDNFVDIEVANLITMEEDIAGAAKVKEDSEGVGDTDALGGGGSRGKQKSKYRYAPIKEQDNIEIKKKNQIRDAEQET